MVKILDFILSEDFELKGDLNTLCFKSTGERGFPGGAVVKNPLPMQGSRVRALVQEDPTCHRATKPVRHNY